MPFSLRWDHYYLQQALLASSMSKDPSTKVGAVIVGPEQESLISGFNGFPRLIHDTPERLNNRELKYKLVVHAEENVLLVASKCGINISGCSLYYAAQDKNHNLVWGGAPCIRCTVSLIQAGIKEVVTYQAPIIDRWAGDMELAKQILFEAGVKLRIIEPEKINNTRKFLHESKPNLQLESLIEQGKRIYMAMTREEKNAMHKAQAESWSKQDKD
jgi:dCMP deaminase